jgi:cytochrome c nitrite reductase small subunit
MTEVKPARKFTLRRGLWLAAALCAGAAIGISAFTVTYAGATSYLGSDPETCTNCHVMEKQYDAWRVGSHAQEATCNDCHLPHTTTLDKYLVKAEDGVIHSTKFTTGDYPENIRIRDKSRQVTNQACLYCHADMTNDLFYAMGADADLDCTRCHANVGHDE